MKHIILVLCLLAPTVAFAQPSGDAAALRKTCVDAMNADPKFADAIVKTAEFQIHEQVNKDQVVKDTCIIETMRAEQDRIARNKLHVILAYGAMWLVAAGFVVFLWRRQQRLTAEIASLRRDLEAAAKDTK
jgi:hypothetical protein